MRLVSVDLLLLVFTAWAPATPTLADWRSEVLGNPPEDGDGPTVLCVAVVVAEALLLFDVVRETAEDEERILLDVDVGGATEPTAPDEALRRASVCSKCLKFFVIVFSNPCKSTSSTGKGSQNALERWTTVTINTRRQSRASLR